MNTPAYNLQQNAYLAPDSVVSKMAKDYAEATLTGSAVRGEYLRILVAYTRQGLSISEQPTKELALAALTTVSDRLYTIVLSAVTTPDIGNDPSLPAPERQRRALERNRRSNFARTAKTELLNFVKADGNILELRPEEVTKESLRAFVAAQRIEPPNGTREGIGTLETKLERAVRALAEQDREAAIEAIDRLHTKLLQIVATPFANRTVQRGELTLHPHH